jgi:hypothetical protein
MSFVDVKTELFAWPNTIDGIDTSKFKPRFFLPMTTRGKIMNMHTWLVNPIRRTAIDELETRALEVINCNIHNPSYIIAEFIAERISMLPIDQSTPVGKEYIINVTNNTGSVLEISTDYILEKKSKQDAKQSAVAASHEPATVRANNCTLFTLEHKNTIRVDMAVMSNIGAKNAAYIGCSAFTLRHTAHQLNPLSDSDLIKDWGFMIETTGTRHPLEVIRLSIVSLIARHKTIRESLNSNIKQIRSTPDNEISTQIILSNILTIFDETTSIADAIFGEFTLLYSERPVITYNITTVPRRAVMRVEHDSTADVEKMLDKTISSIIGKYTELLGSIPKYTP